MTTTTDGLNKALEFAKEIERDYDNTRIAYGAKLVRIRIEQELGLKSVGCVVLGERPKLRTKAGRPAKAAA